MKTGRIYELLSKVYDSLDVIYFKKNKSNPRDAVMDLISGDVEVGI